MIFQSEAGMLYDTIYYGVVFFNRSEIEKYAQSNCKNPQKIIAYYDELQEKIPPLPAILAPFFYYKYEIPSVVSSFFASYLGIANADALTLDEFIESLESNEQRLYQKVVRSVLQISDERVSEYLPTTDPAAYIEAIERLDLPPDFKLQIAFLMGNFGFGVSKLAETLKQVYKYIVDFRQEHKEEIIREYEDILKNHKVEQYRQYYCFDGASEFVGISISLLNPHVMFCYPDQIHVRLLVGIMHDEMLDSYLNNEQVSLDSFLVACGNERRVAIIRALLEHGELTNVQLAQIIGCPATTLISHVEALHNNNIIRVSKRHGVKIFYRLNTACFNEIEKQIGQLVQEIIKKQGE